MDAVNILRGLTDCLTFPFSKIYKATFYHYAAQIHVTQTYSLNYYPIYYIKSYTTVLTVYNGLRVHRMWPVSIILLLTREALDMM